MTESEHQEQAIINTVLSVTRTLEAIQQQGVALSPRDRCLIKAAFTTAHLGMAKTVAGYPADVRSALANIELDKILVRVAMPAAEEMHKMDVPGRN